MKKLKLIKNSVIRKVVDRAKNFAYIPTESLKNEPSCNKTTSFVSKSK